MSVKKLFTRLSVLLVMCAFAVSAKALTAQPTYMDGGMGFIIQVEKNGDKVDDLNGGAPADLQTATYRDENLNPNSAQGIFKDESTNKLFLRFMTPGGIPNDVWLSDITKAKIRTADGVTLDGGKLNQLKEHYPNLAYLDFENASVNNNDWGNLNTMSQLRTLIFPKANGLVIPKQAFMCNSYLKIVIFPDREGNGTYQIMNDAFKYSDIETLSLGKGYTITDMSSQTNEGVSIFEHCTYLKNVVLDNSITRLGAKAFSATYSLEYLILPEELQEIGALCFKECGIRTVTFPEHLNLSGYAGQVFQGCVQLTNLYVTSDNVPAAMRSIMEEQQTMNFQRTATSTTEFSIEDYETRNKWTSSDYNHEEVKNGKTITKSPFLNAEYTCPILHYPGTVSGIANYRLDKYMHYTGVDEATGTTWPKNNNEISPYNSLTVDGVTYPGWSNNDSNSPYAGWRMFPIGNNTFKEQNVFYDERIKESRWYSICLPVNMTEAQFMNAYGIGAALHEFSGAVYDPDKGAIILQFNTPATAGSDGILLKKNVPYMIHPAKVKLSKRKVVTTHIGDNGEVEGVEFVTTSGQDYATTEVIATYDVESDLFVKWDIMLYGQDPTTGITLEQAINTIKSNTASALTAAAVTKSVDASQAPAGQKPLPADFTFKGSYLGAKLYAPTDIYVGESPKLPEGAYYLGYDPNTMTQPKFFKAKGSGTWIPYGALIEKTGASASGAGAKEFDTLNLDFNDMSDYMVETGIGAPTIQIPVVNTSNKVYNLNGQVVRENSKDTNGLKGIYIVGGKKVIFN